MILGACPCRVIWDLIGTLPEIWPICMKIGLVRWIFDRKKFNRLGREKIKKWRILYQEVDDLSNEMQFNKIFYKYFVN